ncbi:MAG: class I SAM-dependent methyltransferase [Bacteroidota bacterium]|nr:class I SAM-dependent methyltransferase [Bacteroidota bacterium]
MDLHDYKDVAENYDLYINDVVESGFNNASCIKYHMDLASAYGKQGILDIACGTGLVLVPLVKEGYNVIGIDVSKEMLAQTKSKLDNMQIFNNYELICSNMAQFSINKQVSLAIIPRSGFIHLTNPSEQIETLTRINNSLVLGGVLSLNTFYPSYEIVYKLGKGKVTEPFYKTSFVGKDGNKVKIFNYLEYDYESQIIQGKWIFNEVDSMGNILNSRERPVLIRWTFKSEMDLLFNLCGFEVIEMFGNYDKVPTNYPGHIVWIVKKVKHLN